MNNKSFDDRRIAEGYAKRPWLHKSVMEQIKTDCNLEHNFRKGLDVGCGAGLSTKALKLICDKVTGTDIAESMVEICKELYKDSGYSFYTAAAEDTRTTEELYDIVTAAGVINWVDRELFLQNMHEVMASGGLLVIYDFWITEGMLDNTAYTEWYQNEYLQNFPKPPRNEMVWSQKDLTEDFILQNQIKYHMQYEFDLESFIDFMMIQSNVNVQIENGEKSVGEVREWMSQTLQPIFQGQTRTLIFSGYNWYIKHI